MDERLALIASVLEDHFELNDIQRALEKHKTVEQTIDHLLKSREPWVYIKNVLDPLLADQFLDHLMQESGSWKPLVTNIVGVSLKSHHTTQLYSTSDFEYTYSGRKSSAKQETEMMRLVGHIIESVVNREKQKRPRERYEVLEWKPDLVIGNRYTKNEYGGAHSDKLTNIGPHPIIAGLTLGAGRTFRLIRNKIYGKRTVDLILEHNSLLIMFPPCQEEYKHEIPPVSQKRLHLTGRLIPHPISKETRINLTLPYVSAISRQNSSQ